VEQANCLFLTDNQPIQQGLPLAARLVEHRLGDIKLVGYSVAGEETVIAAPELNVCFDVGRAPPEMLSVDHVFLTHGHMDHSAGLAYYFSQRNFVGNAPGCVIAPKTLVQPIRDLMTVWGRIEGHVSPNKVVGMSDGETYEIRRGLITRAFDVNHRVAALGYCIIDVRHKLKSEFADRSGPELVALKKQGVVIEHQVEIPLIAYAGDTAEGNWIDLEMVRGAKVLILECTFFDAEHVRRAREGYHLHVRDVARMLLNLPNEHIVVHHVTRRTGIGEAKRALSGLVGKEIMERVTFMMDVRRGRAVHADAPPPQDPIMMQNPSGQERGAPPAATPNNDTHTQ
jgi:ribonuclease Z